MNKPDPITESLACAKSVTMSAAEKARMRASLAQYAMRPHAARQHPLRRLVDRSLEHVVSPYQWVLTKPAVLAAVLMVALLGGGSVSYAAQGALPGDVLYPIKVHVNEPVAETLAFSTKAQATVQAAIATNRLVEAEQLAAKGTLGTTTAVMLVAAFTEHANAAHEKAAELAKDDPLAAAEVTSSLAARIAANEDILDAFSSDHAEASPAHGMIASLTAHLAAHPGSTDTSSTTASALSVQAFAALERRAENRLGEARAAVTATAARSATAATTSAITILTLRADAELRLAGERFTLATTSLAADKKTAAYDAFLDSIDASLRAQTYTEAILRAYDDAARTTRPAASDTRERDQRRAPAISTPEREEWHSNTISPVNVRFEQSVEKTDGDSAPDADTSVDLKIEIPDHPDAKGFRANASSTPKASLND